MRIVGGRLGGRQLRVPVGKHTRPTSERVREAIASVLDARGAIDGAQVLELYAGTGALGFELLSRGAARVLFVEKDAAMSGLLKISAQELDLSAQVEVLRADVTRERGQQQILERGPFSLVLADPPYADADSAVACLEALRSRGLLGDDALLLLETSAKRIPDLPPDFELLSNYRYGDTAVALFHASTAAVLPGGEER
jgi:16S rRNA (guanine966-N2)-methyltransferase